MEKPVSKEILFEYFSGRATLLQKRMIEEWLLQPENECYFYQCLDEWENTYPQHMPDTQKALAMYEQFMDKTASRPKMQADAIPAPFFQLPRFRWLAVAVISLLLVAAGILGGKNYWYYQTYSTGLGQTRILTLADNSQVTLNSNSSLKISRPVFAGSEREVWLTGEAFFNISKTIDKKRFVVHTSTLEVEVLGTQFNVADRRSKTKVVLQEGKVKITSNVYPETQPVLMQPGEYVEHSPRKAEIKKKAVKTNNYTAWRENKLIFEKSPLKEVLETVEDYYNVRIDLKDTSLVSKQYTGILPTNDLEVILKSLSNIYELKATQEENRIILQ